MRRGQHARALVGEQIQPARGIAARAQEFAAFVGPGHREVSAGSYRNHSRVGGTLQLQQKRPHQQQEGDEAGHRVARQPHEMRRAAGRAPPHLPIGERLAGLHGDLPEIKLAELLDRGLDVVFLAHRDAAGGEDQVVPFGGRLQRGQRGGAVVRHDAQVAHRAAQAQQQRAQEEAVAVVDGTRLHLRRGHLTRHHQFVAGGEQRHPRACGHQQAVHANSGRQPKTGGRKPLSFSEYGGTAGDVLAGLAYPVAAPGHGVDTHARGAAFAFQRLGVFLHHHGVGTRRHGRAGEDPGGTAGGQRLGRVAGGDALRHRQLHAGPGDVDGAHGVAVHRGVVLRRHLQLGHQILREHAAVGIEGAERFDLGQRGGVAEHAPQGFIERHQRRTCPCGRCGLGGIRHGSQDSRRGRR